jgi:uncharacterized protein
MRRGLIIFAREPVPGRVKTRLAGNIGNIMAAELYAAMLMDTIHKAALLSGTEIYLFWATESAETPKLPGFQQLKALAQRGYDLGERMQNAFRTVFNDRISSCCIVGTDSPDLPVEIIINAFDALERADIDVVLGPASDGGYYLIGMKQPHDWLFSNMEWSTPDVARLTQQRITEKSLNCFTLPEWHDVDILEDLERLATSSEMSAPQTFRVLNSILPVHLTSP